jgi:hypothetical protein
LFEIAAPSKHITLRAHNAFSTQGLWVEVLDQRLGIVFAPCPHASESSVVQGKRTRRRHPRAERLFIAWRALASDVWAKIQFVKRPKISQGKILRLPASKVAFIYGSQLIQFAWCGK